MATITEQLQQLYVAYFNRPADVGGLTYWTNAINAGGTIAQVAAAFSVQPEYTSVYGSKQPDQVIDQVYLNLFGRHAEQGGLDYWGGILQKNPTLISQIVTAIVAGAKNADGTPNTDGVAYNNKVAAAGLFTVELQTVGNEAERVAYAAGTDAVKTIAKNFISSVTDDASLATATAGLHATAQQLSDVTVVGQTIALTTGIDQGPTFVGGAGNDTFNAVSVSTAGAFNALDKIDGGAGTNTLNVIDTNAINLANGSVTVKNIQSMNVTDSSTVTLDTTSFTGLKELNIAASSGADDITAATTTAVSVTDTAAGGVSVDGGSKQTISAVGAVTSTGSAGAVVITETGAGQLATAIAVDDATDITITSKHNQGGTITVGAAGNAVGAVVINSAVDAANTGGLITVNGGTTVNVTQTATNAAGTNVTAESAVTVNGGSATTAVTVTQAAVVTGATAVTGVTGVSAVTAVPAAVGTQAVAAVTAVTQVTAVAAAAGIAADGLVTIVDAKYNTTSANTIKSVTLNNYGASSVIRSNALTNLSLSGTAGTLTITNATNGAGGVATANNTLALAVNGLSGTNSILDTNNEITTLNVTTGATASTLAAFTDTGLTKLNIAGSSTLQLNAINSSLTAITVSGAAGFSDNSSTAAGGFAARAGAATLVTTSSGAITAALDSTTQSFIGSTGKDTITVSALADATKVITGGSGTTDELVLEGGAYALTSATGAKITGFETLGVAANVTGTIDMSALATGFTGLHIKGNSTIAFSKVAANTTLKLDVASTSVTYGVANATGAADTVTVTLGGASSDSVNFGTVVLKDANSVGIGTVNLVSNGVNITAADAIANFNTVVLTDNGLSNLNVSGTQGIAITTINQTATQATSFNLNNTNTGSAGVVIGTLTDTNLGALNFSGTGSSTINTLVDASSTTLSIANTGSKLATIGAFTTTANLTNLTLTGNVQIGAGLVGDTPFTMSSTAGITVAGATDHAHVSLSLGAAAVGLTNSVTLGNGNNVVTDATIAGTSNITVGTGSNFLTVGGATTNTTGAFNITLGAHTAATGSDYITVGTGGTAYATAANYVITGAVTGDRIIFNTDSAANLVGHTAGVITATTAGATAALTIAALETAVDALAAHGVAYAQFGGNTYIAESIASALGGTDTTIVELVGLHTVTAGTGYVAVAS